MAQILNMPRLSDTMSEGRLIKWHKKEGDKIAPGDVLAEVETDKANMDFESFDDGVLLKIIVGDGQTAPVGGPVAIIGKAGEDVSEMLANLKSGEPAPAPKAAAPATPKPAEKQAPATPVEAKTPAKPQPEQRAATPPQTQTRTPTQTGTRTSAQPAPSAPPSGNGHGRILASPLARRIADERGIDLRQVQGSGPAGRITKEDVEKFQPGAAPAVETRAPAAERPAVESRPIAVALPPGEPQPLSMMRKTIARRMTEAKQQTPHFYLTAEADMDAAVAFRGQVNEALGVKISFNDLVVKACALALRRLPQVNASWADGGIIVHDRVHVGVAVAIEDGLITPVVQDADMKSLGAIAREVQDLAALARDRKLRPEHYTGGTFTVSNLGMFGVEEFAAIINPPEAAILAVGAVRKVPVVKGDSIGIGHRMKVTLSGDHRVIDGATGAKFLQEVLRILEHPMTLAM
jgi:pyruvate dehydrogenase E2 component (dihydrolipoamide acetyltransferase)